MTTKGGTKEARHFALITLLSIVFTIGLTFASVEFPRLLDTFLAKNVDSPDIATGSDDVSDYKTELYLRHFRLRWVGYGCLAFILVLIVVGFVTEKTGWTSAGALFLFLPIFGHFAATMFFLGGLGFLHLLWLPFLDVSFSLFRLGDIINLPYNALCRLYSLTGLGPRLTPAHILTGLGLLFFFLGTLTWFYARTRKNGVADLWIYRFSRHPQYLGWIVWSYGMLYLPSGHNIKLCYDFSNSLPWLFSTMIIIGVAMVEEIRMKRTFGETYESYLSRAPFLFPLPRFISKASALPLRLMFKKEHPERKREVLAVLAFYTFLCLVLSAFYGGLVSRPERKTQVSTARIDKLVRVLKDSDDRGEKREAAAALSAVGEPALEPLLALTGDRASIVRAYAASALGGLKSERATPSLIALLQDEDSYVRRSAAGALGGIGSARAVPPLIEALEDPAADVVGAAARALGRINHPDVLPALIALLRNPGGNVVAAAVQALGDLGVPEAVGPLVQCLEERPDCPYHLAAEALRKLKSDRAADAWITGLKKGSWWYPRAACAAELAKYKPDQAEPALIEALKDESPEVRRAVVLALMEFPSEKTKEALRSVLNDTDMEVRIYAAEALKKISPADRGGPGSPGRGY